VDHHLENNRRASKVVLGDNSVVVAEEEVDPKIDNNRYTKNMIDIFSIYIENIIRIERI
jgi:hypothetical protein